MAPDKAHNIHLIFQLQIEPPFFRCGPFAFSLNKHSFCGFRFIIISINVALQPSLAKVNDSSFPNSHDCWPCSQLPESQVVEVHFYLSSSAFLLKVFFKTSISIQILFDHVAVNCFGMLDHVEGSILVQVVWGQ